MVFMILLYRILAQKTCYKPRFRNVNRIALRVNIIGVAVRRTVIVARMLLLLLLQTIGIRIRIARLRIVARRRLSGGVRRLRRRLMGFAMRVGEIRPENGWILEQCRTERIGRFVHQQLGDVVAVSVQQIVHDASFGNAMVFDCWSELRINRITHGVSYFGYCGTFSQYVLPGFAQAGVCPGGAGTYRHGGAP